MKASGIFLSVNTEVGESIGTRDRFCGLTEFSLNATAGKLHVRPAAKTHDGHTINHGFTFTAMRSEERWYDNC